MLNVAQEQFSSGGVADMLPGLNLDENVSRVDASGNYAMLRDGLGSTIGLVNSAGALGTQYQYGPFGQTTTSGASSTNPLQYTGRELDSTGLDFMRARYYNPIAQRFISPDPIGLSGGQVDFYAYAGNDPTGLADPTVLGSVIVDSVSSLTPAISPPPPPISAQADAPVGGVYPDGAVGNVTSTLLEEIGFPLRRRVPYLPRISVARHGHGSGHGARPVVRIPLPPGGGGYSEPNGLGQLGDLFLLVFLSMYLLARGKESVRFRR